MARRKKIVKRLRNGVENKNNTITKICINKAMGEWIHPTYKTDNLFRELDNNKQNFNNNITIECLQTLSSDQQNALN